MGYLIQDIANIMEPARLTLSGLPNFIQLSSKTTGGTRFTGRIAPSSAVLVTVSVQDGGGAITEFQSTLSPDDVGGTVFFLSTNAMQTAENLRLALLNDAYIAANYDVYSDIAWNSGAPTVNGVVITAKEVGTEFNLALTALGATVTFTNGSGNDSIKGTEPLVDINVDLYEVAVGAYITTSPPAGSLGTFLVRLSKTYNGAPLWFDLNGIAAQRTAFTSPPDAVNTWFGTGTLTAYRAAVSKGGYTTSPVYISEVLYALSGYGALSDPRELLADYAYVNSPVRQLTERPTLPYVRGQREFVNFMKGAPLAGKTFGILKRAYDGLGNYLGSQAVSPSAALNAINSCAFDFNTLIDTHPTAVLLTVAVTLNGTVVSDVLRYDLRPECLHVRNEFYFINRLGGWDTFNFDAAGVEESKPTGDTYTRTVTPTYARQQGVEASYTADLDATVTVQGAPVSKEIGEWLRQLEVAKVILDKDGNRILLEDFTLRLTDGEATVPTIKYRLSETFTNGY